ncbi:hypothetical protein [Actinocatenispora sera]|uniref:Uncharacterized protein n=1 Tax=Actinocatenispora sera TaxID=390989 RepID=A0A810L7R1_9ACTN|nr:hypothetical protein [Actinocatenispora sera]BCJ31600.1 hypothetical protein Asera_57080 [Actinocatenispora sera]
MTEQELPRPRVAVLATTWFPGSHADVIATRLVEGYRWQGAHRPARVEVASVYLEQLGSRTEVWPLPDVGVEITDRNGVPRFPTVAEALGVGRPGVDVDGVVIIGEHGDYERNEYGQTTYPRRRLFDAAVSTMLGAGRTVPVFNDKGLAWSYPDALSMVDTAERLGIPLLAGSTIPLSWRIPTATQWPLGEPMDAAVVVGWGPLERYGFHNLEALQVHAERRSGGERGVATVRALTGPDARDAIEARIVDAALLDAALGTFELTAEQRARARASVRDVFLVQYRDGLRAAVVLCNDVLRNFGTACRGPGHEMACQIWLPGAPHEHFTFLVRQIESLVLGGVAPYPVRRTLLTTGMLDAAMHSLHDGARIDTPDLDRGYTPVATVTDTGVELPRPEGVPTP